MNSKTHAGSLAKGATPGRGSSWSPGSRLELVPRAGDGGENPGSGRGGGGSVSRAGGRSRDANGFLTRNLSEKVAHRRIRTADHENGPPESLPERRISSA